MQGALVQALTFDASGQGEGKDLLRFITCGSVDDGKSTLIGRLLHDSRLIHEDQLSALARDSVRHGTNGHDIDFALLLDGLEAEREQGITIDVAYRYFSTARRSFIVADTPGHAQYTRNMATGASNAEFAVILIDARKGVLAQTRRHSLICSLLGIRNVVITVNKMDLVDFSRPVFAEIVADYRAFATQLDFDDITFIPISARFGDNVAARSTNAPWYEGRTFLSHLEAVTANTLPPEMFRFPVQWVNRPNSDFRGYAGTMASGEIRPGDKIVSSLTRRGARIKEIVTHDGNLASARAGDAVTITLDAELDIARGDILVKPEALAEVSDAFAAHVLWMAEEPLFPGRAYLARIGTRTVPISVTAIKHKVDVNTAEHLAAEILELNDVGFCHLSTAQPVAFDPYTINRKTGAFIVIDRTTNNTVGAGMISSPLQRGSGVLRQPLSVGKAARAALKQQTPVVLWFTGLSGAGKSTIANLVEQKLHAAGLHTVMLDGDNLRHGLNRDLGFTEADRVENIRRAGEVAKLMTEAGLIAICSFISPYRAERNMVRAMLAEGEFIEIFVDTPIEECIRRDPKGLYAKARAGHIKHFTGLDAPYEAPAEPDIRLRTQETTPEALAEIVLRHAARYPSDRNG